MLLASVKGPLDQAEKDIILAKGKADGLELRLDAFETLHLSSVASLIQQGKQSGLKVLLTCRPIDQGGFYAESEEKRLQYIEQLCTLSPDFFDLEYNVPPEFTKRLVKSFPSIQFLISYHDFEKTPQDLEALLKKIHRDEINIYKIATLTHSTLDALRLIEFVKKERPNCRLTAIGMGAHGAMTRVLGPVIGGFLDYAPLQSASQTAPGQIEVDSLLQDYRYRSLSPHTKLFTLIGHPINHSLSHLSHNAVFDAYTCDACYVKMDLIETELASFFTHIRSLDQFKGLSVTMPLKEAVIPYLDDLSPSARIIGAVNTISSVEGRLIGHNTDGIGALNALEAIGPVKGKHIVLLGAGGAAKAIAYEALQRGSLVTVINRTSSKAEKLAKSLNCQGGGMDLFPRIREEGYDILINCTPDGNVIDNAWIHPGAIVMDIVSRPQHTPFLQKASQLNCRAVFGYEMFIYQAVEQQLIWFGWENKTGSLKEIIEKTVLKNLK